MLRVLALVTASVMAIGASARAEVLVPELPRRNVSFDEAAKEASDAFKKAGRLAEAGRFDQAVVSSKLAFAMLPNSATAGLLCAILGELGQPKDAFEKCLIGLALNPNAEERAYLESTLTQLGAGAGLGWASFDVKPAGAKLTTSGASFEAPRIVGLSPGEHEVTVQAEGYEPATVTVRVGTGQQAPVVVALARHVEQPKEPDPSLMKPVEPSGIDQFDLGVGMLVAGGVIGLSGIGFTAWALDAESQLQNLEDDEQTRENREPLLTDRERGNGAAIIMYSIGGAAIVTGIVLMATAPSAPEADEPEDTTLRLTPVGMPSGGGGLVLDGRF